jgi:E3 ubiquitin-protein ligase DOA10
MVTSTNILFSVAAVKRLLGLASDIQVQIREFFKVIWVWIKGKRPTFISKAKFTQHFVDRRKAQSKDIQAIQNSESKFTAFNPESGSRYSVDVSRSMIACSCEDYRNQITFLGRGCCKHGYAVLEFLGFSSLKDYLNA